MLKCNRYVLLKGEGEAGFEPSYTEVKSVERANALSGYMVKHDIPMDLNINIYKVECYYNGELLGSFATAEWSNKITYKEIEDYRGHYVVRNNMNTWN